MTMRTCSECPAEFTPKNRLQLVCERAACKRDRATRLWLERRRSDAEFRDRTKKHVREYRRRVREKQ